ncbi:metabotropic glycine receptor isoform X2 [Drosophila takahashii]|uniref:metabotropic glycine receptor isoform X2 n=1 Tax=Drosophila takahashii TaxID=29030 RepID=UPI003898D798
MELCIATKSKKQQEQAAQSSMQQSKCNSSSNSNYYQKKCHQNQTNTQVQSTQQSNCSSHRDRDHLTKQQQNQRTNSATATSSNFNRSNIISSSSSSNIKSKNIRRPSRSTQLNTLYSLLVLLIVGLATVAVTVTASPHHPQATPATPFSRETRRDALLAYYKRAHLQPSGSSPGHEHEYHLHQDANGLDFDELTPTVSSVSVLSRAERLRLRKRSATPTTAAAAATSPVAAVAPAAATSTTAAAKEAANSKKAEEEKCEPRVLETQPDEPFYDYTDIAEDAARQFIEFLSSKFPNANTPITIDEPTRAEVSRRANGIASYALNEDDNLLAFAIAAPSIHTVVVKFRDNVTIPPDQVHNKAYLGSYWRELGAAWNSTDGTQEWGAPFRDCNLLTRRWLWPFRISFSEHRIKVVAAAFIAADEDVCNDGLEEVFGRRHGCDRNTTFCLLTENKPAATRDVYTCLCRESYYLPNSTLQGFRGDRVELSEGYDNYSCIPCPGGCSNCDSNGVCLTFQEEEVLNVDACLRLLVAIVLGACILCCVVLGVIVFRQRKCKAIASGMWTVLETILLGIVLLYASVAVHFFPASTERCLLEPWLRELGFITCYGAIILKLYRHLVDFRTRKAHRWVLRDVDLLKYLGTMVFAVICYMAAFTASSLDLLESAQLESLREADTNTCHPLKWELVTQTSEMLILCFGLHLAIASRNANTQFRERQFLVTALTLEFLVSSSFYFLRFLYLPEMSPSAILLALFIRSQLTNSFALGLIFVPKLWYQHKQVRSLAYDLSIRLPVDAFKGTSHDAGQRLGGGYAGLCLGDPDIGELTISEMSPEDIRAELKRLYTQLEIMKNKTLRQDNPHISKRRGGRKAGHRRFSLQALSAKHRSNKHHQDIEITEAEPSRTPEDSVCSAEGPTDTYAEISGVSHSMLSHSMVSHSVVSHSK